MYFDSKPCTVCGSEVRLTARRESGAADPGGPVGEPDGIVGDADSTVDVRVCTNAECPTNRTDASSSAPTP
ncbi:MAG: hypothetical protein ABWX84_06530 [Nocardioides sp.]